MRLFSIDGRLVFFNVPLSCGFLLNLYLNPNFKNCNYFSSQKMNEMLRYRPTVLFCFFKKKKVAPPMALGDPETRQKGEETPLAISVHVT